MTKAGKWVVKVSLVGAAAAAVGVMGAERARQFFGSGNPLGRIIRIGDHALQVVGVLAYREFYWNRSDRWNALSWMNELFLVPATTMNHFANSGWTRREMEGVLVPLATYRAYIHGGKASTS